LTFYEEHYCPIEHNTAPTRVNEGNSKTSTRAFDKGYFLSLSPYDVPVILVPKKDGT
jgi:hypothetical protein